MPPLESAGSAHDAGRAARQETPRRALAVLADRPEAFDPVDRLLGELRGRPQELQALRFERMLTDPLAFLRGGALLMAEDLARGPMTSIEVQLCGDAHLMNFGVFSSPERQLVFDVDDFDETAPGPFELDVKRLTASLAVTADHLGHDPRGQGNLVAEAAREYQRSMQRFSQLTRLDVWYAALDLSVLRDELRGYFGETALALVGDVVGRAKGRAPMKAFERLIVDDASGLRIRSNPPTTMRLDELGEAGRAAREVLDDVLSNYAATLSSDRRVLLGQFTPVDMARHVVGVGSVGTECFAVLLTGRDEFDPFFLQVKQAQASALSRALGSVDALEPGERVVSGQKLLQATSDIFLGWRTSRAGGEPSSFYVRQLYDHKASVDVERLDETHLAAYGRVCAWVLARAHARSGRSREIAGYLGQGPQFAKSMVEFALAYRDRNEADLHSLARAFDEGRVPRSP
jgi:uncharacterized protein (DUF2252 family)